MVMASMSLSGAVASTVNPLPNSFRPLTMQGIHHGRSFTVKFMQKTAFIDIYWMGMPHIVFHGVNYISHDDRRIYRVHVPPGE